MHRCGQSYIVLVVPPPSAVFVPGGVGQCCMLALPPPSLLAPAVPRKRGGRSVPMVSLALSSKRPPDDADDDTDNGDDGGDKAEDADAVFADTDDAHGSGLE